MRHIYITLFTDACRLYHALVIGVILCLYPVPRCFYRPVDRLRKSLDIATFG